MDSKLFPPLQHAEGRMVERGITDAEIDTALGRGEIRTHVSDPRRAVVIDKRTRLVVVIDVVTRCVVTAYHAKGGGL